MSVKIAIPATAPDLDGRMESKFGRAPSLMIVNVDTLAFESVENTSRDAQAGAGIETAQTLSKHRVTGVIAEKFGPKAQQALRAAGISMFLCKGGLSVREALARYARGDLEELRVSEGTEGRAGRGMGQGQGQGRGRGQGMGLGRGQGGGGGRRK